MIEEKKIVFPKENYTIIIPGGGKDSEFVVKPLPEKVQEEIINLHMMGAEVRFMPNRERPTSIFISYDHEYVEPARAFEAPVCPDVLAVKLKLHLGLLGNHHKSFAKKLDKFKGDMMIVGHNELPANSESVFSRSVTVINEYKY